MPLITLPDASQKQLPGPITIREFVTTLNPRLAKDALVAEVNGQLVDLSYTLSADATLRVITEQDAEALTIIRHSSAHLLAQAVKQLFPAAQMAIGPVIEDGFYYDFAYEHSFVPEDLVLIENRMLALAQEDFTVQRFLLSHQEALALFQQQGESYKVKIIEALPDDEVISLYRQGDFIDLCRGPHVPSTCHLKAFKLMQIAGAYWQGNANNPMLQRIYGTAWANKKELTAYLHRLEEAKKRDHRKLAKQLDLYHSQEEAPGMIFWHPLGWEIYQVIEHYIRGRLRAAGYQEVRTPQILSRQFWEASGHWDKFFAEMFITCSETHEFAIKPMNCPGHVQIFNQGLRSHHDLPLRLAEFGACHRNEPSGGLHGLMRVRGFAQDDAHIFCTEVQLQAEIASFIELLYAVYADFGFKDVLLRLATRPVQRLGSDESWDKAEQALTQTLLDKGLKWDYAAGEGAFYGPKLEFSLRDSLGRLWQCGTIQVDFSMPERLSATYVAENGSRQRPVMLHRAILGSLERFIGILIEHYAGAFPVWLAPIQVVVMTITDRQADYARELGQALQALGLRITLDLRNEKINFKIREHSLSKIPYQLVIGDLEQATNTVTVRQHKGVASTNMPLAAFQQLIMAAVAEKT